MSQLRVDYASIEGGPHSHTVEVNIKSAYTAILWGFVREKDAAIAMHFLSSLPVNWCAPRREMWRQIRAAGYANRDELLKAACKRLQW